MNKIGLSLIVILLINVLYVDNNYSNNIGYIEIDSIKIKNGIVNGISEEILNL